MSDIRKSIRKFFAKEDDGYVTYDEFRNYYLKFVSIHRGCGEDCEHLKRFYAKIGFTTPRFQRRNELIMAKVKLLPF